MWSRFINHHKSVFPYQVSHNLTCWLFITWPFPHFLLLHIIIYTIRVSHIDNKKKIICTHFSCYYNKTGHQIAVHNMKIFRTDHSWAFTICWSISHSFIQSAISQPAISQLAISQPASQLSSQPSRKPSSQRASLTVDQPYSLTINQSASHFAS